MSDITPRFRLFAFKDDLGPKNILSDEQRAFLIEHDYSLILDALKLHRYEKGPPYNIRWDCLYITKDGKAGDGEHLRPKGGAEFLDDPHILYPALVIKNRDVLQDNIKEILYRFFYTDGTGNFKFRVEYLLIRDNSNLGWRIDDWDFHGKKMMLCKFRFWIKNWKKLGKKGRGNK